jgi:hypothetical protein
MPPKRQRFFYRKIKRDQGHVANTLAERFNESRIKPYGLGDTLGGAEAGRIAMVTLQPLSRKKQHTAAIMEALVQIRTSVRRRLGFTRTFSPEDTDMSVHSRRRRTALSDFSP